MNRRSDRLAALCALLLVLPARAALGDVPPGPDRREAAPRVEPQPRAGHTMVTIGDQVYLFGGEAPAAGARGELEQAVLNDLWNYDFEDNIWSPVTVQPKPQARAYHAATVWNGNMYILGGRGQGGTNLADIWAFNPTTASWAEMPSLGPNRPRARYGASAVTIGDLIYYFAGEDGDDWTWSYDPATGTWVREPAGWPTYLPTNQSGSAFGNAMFIFGGHVTWTNTYWNSVWEFNPSTHAWTQVQPSGDPPAPRAYNASVPADDRWYILGGNDSSQTFSDVWEFRYSLPAWIPCPALPRARTRTAASRLPTAEDTWMLVFGGQEGDQTLAETALYSPDPCALLCWAFAFPNTGRPPLTVGFTSLVNSQNCQEQPLLTWRFGDGTSSDLPQALHTYSQPGKYNWQFEATLAGRTCTRSGIVTVEEEPCTLECRIEVAPRLGKAPLYVEFGATMTPRNCPEFPTSYWDFGDGSHSDQPFVTHAYSLPGVYTYSFYGQTGPASCGTVGTIEVLPPCELTNCQFTASPISGRAPLQVQFEAEHESQHCDGQPVYLLETDGHFYGGPAAEHTYDKPGTYTWAMAITLDDKICTGTGTVTVSPPLPGDADGDGLVSIGEIVQAINMFLGEMPPGNNVDCDGDGLISIGEVQRVINAFLGEATSC